MIVLRISLHAKATPMPKPDTPELDTWLDQEISSLLEAVASNANGGTAPSDRVGRKSGLLSRAARLPKASPVRGFALSGEAVRDLRRKLRLLSGTLVYLAIAVALGVVAAWLTVMFTKP